MVEKAKPIVPKWIIWIALTILIVIISAIVIVLFVKYADAPLFKGVIRGGV